jgi:hypothetical protein
MFPENGYVPCIKWDVDRGWVSITGESLPDDFFISDWQRKPRFFNGTLPPDGNI